jgi:VWFA-related protein
MGQNLSRVGIPGATLLMAASLLAPPFASGQDAGGGEPVELSAETVILPVTVRGADGRPVKGLTAADFEVTEDRRRVPLEAFAVVERPLRLVLFFDTSVSLVSTLPAVREEARRLVDLLREDDRVSVSWFAKDAFTEVQWLDKAEAKSRIDLVLPAPHLASPPPPIVGPGYGIGDTNTFLYDALLSLIGRFDSGEPTAVVLFSDGVDTSGGRTTGGRRKQAQRLAQYVIERAQASWVCFYPVRYKTSQSLEQDASPRVVVPVIRLGRGGGGRDPGAKFLGELAATSGGTQFEFADQKDLTRALASALDELRSRYLLAYPPPESGARAGFHSVEVKVRRPNCTVRTRPGYAVSGTR